MITSRLSYCWTVLGVLSGSVIVNARLTRP